MLRRILLATAFCGTLDILFAIILTMWFGRDVGNMLRFVASGPFPGATGMGAAGAVVGLLVHFAIMAAMAAALLLLVERRPELSETPLRTGAAFGVLTYFLMNWVVVPLRFGTPLPLTTISIVTQMFAHIALVGIPMAYIAAGRWDRPRSAEA